MSSFMSPLESRQSTNANKVRMFGYDELQKPERDEKWDVVKIVCTQPFNRHVQYGLSFITLHTPENKDALNANAIGSTKFGCTLEDKEASNTTAITLNLGKFTLRPNSPNNLTTGSLFARRNSLNMTNVPSAAAAIRDRSTSIASPYKSPKLKISTKPSTMSNQQDIPLSNTSSETLKRRNRDELLYCQDEEDDHEKIDNLIKKRKKELEEKQTTEIVQQKNKQKNTHIANGKKVASPVPSTSHATKRKQKDPSTTSPKKNKIQKLSKPYNQLLDGVTIVISGIENPERSTIRNNALELGAKYKADWDNSCTHLVCAFTNTPKFNQVKGKGKIVNRLWISDCHTQRKRLPWRRYALDRKDLGKAESEDEIYEDIPRSPEVFYGRSNIKSDSGADTEDEIERISAMKKQETVIRSSYSVDTDEDIIKPVQNNDLPELPSILNGKKLYIDDELSEDEKKLLRRYIVALNGTVLDVPTEVDFIITTSKNVNFLKEICSTAHAVTADWVWDCYNKNEFVPINAFEL
ncbi:hypothetical protein RI129_007485 [Pyrocoelia pectoralis]|uniref:BRCT domain-containing protein n=1 Tax=Pyrocoelia pectoralis TaxID=417401 RepID=A0AAN7ZEW6_9COLE